MSDHDGRGVIYVATGARYVKEAVASARSLRAAQPGVRIGLFTDQGAAAGGDTFDEVRAVPERGWVRSGAKVWAMANSPFTQTVFLDSDTHVCGSLEPLFPLLERFDLVGVAVNHRVFERRGHGVGAELPSAFPSYNSGMLAFRRNDATDELFEDWAELYAADAQRRKKILFDQPSLRLAAWRSDCRLLFVSQEYNCRFLIHPVVASGRVRVLHGRADDIESIERKVNRTTEPRLVSPFVTGRVDRWLRRSHARHWRG